MIKWKIRVIIRTVHLYKKLVSPIKSTRPRSLTEPRANGMLSIEHLFWLKDTIFYGFDRCNEHPA